MHDAHSPDALPKLDRDIEEQLEAEVDAHLGVMAVEAAEKVYGRYSKWFLFIGCVSRSLFSPCFPNAFSSCSRLHSIK